MVKLTIILVVNSLLFVKSMKIGCDFSIMNKLHHHMDKFEDL